MNHPQQNATSHYKCLRIELPILQPALRRVPNLVPGFVWMSDSLQSPARNTALLQHLADNTLAQVCSTSNFLPAKHLRLRLLCTEFVYCALHSCSRSLAAWAPGLGDTGNNISLADAIGLASPFEGPLPPPQSMRTHDPGFLAKGLRHLHQFWGSGGC